MKFLKKIFSIEDIYEHKKKYKVITIFNNNIKYEVKNTLKNCIAIIGPGGIGDYMFCRPYFKYFKESPKYRNCKFVFFAKSVYFDFVKEHDKKYFDYIVSYDKNLGAVKTKLANLNIFKFQECINLHYITLGESKEWGVRLNLIRSLKKDKTIADIINFEHIDSSTCKDLSIYDEVIISEEKGKAEIVRRRDFFEKLLYIKIPVGGTELTSIFNLNNPFILISICAGSSARRYNKKDWIKIINNIIQNTDSNFQLLFLGGVTEYNKINDVIKKVNDKNRCVNLAGNLPISLLPVLLTKAEFLLSVETGTVHIAHSVGCKTICLCCGAYYGRFQPYNEFVEYIYPDEFDRLLVENRARVEDEFYNINWTFKTNDIAPEKVIKVLDKYIEEFKVGKIDE